MKKRKCWNCKTIVESQIYKNLKTIPVCPCCGVQYPEKPKLEAKLTILQDVYLENPSSYNFEQLFMPLKELTFHIICHHLNKTSSRLNPDNINDMVQWTLMKLVSYYKEKDFKIEGSFTGYIEQVVLYPIYNKKDKEKAKKEISIHTPLNENSNRTLLDKLSEQTLDDVDRECINLSEFYKQEIFKNIEKFLTILIEKKFSILQSQNDSKSFSHIIELLSIYDFYIQHKHDKFFTEMWKTYSVDVRDEFEKSIELLKKELKSIVAS